MPDICEHCGHDIAFHKDTGGTLVFAYEGQPEEGYSALFCDYEDMNDLYCGCMVAHHLSVEDIAERKRSMMHA